MMPFRARGPSLSVLLPVYNCEAYLDEAIGSIREQRVANFEIVAVNDGSTDNSLAILRHHSARDARMMIIDKSNGGIVSALNAGLAICRGRYVARMDGDDVAESGRLIAQSEFLDKHPGIGGVGGAAIIIDEAGRQIGEVRNPTDTASVDTALSRGAYAVLHPTLMVRRECMTAVGNYDPAFRYAEDLDLLLRLREVTRLANLSQVVLRYRRRSASMSDTGTSCYPEWDMKALLAARRRRRGAVTSSTLARAAERVSWTAMDEGDYATAARLAWQAFGYAPLNAAGPRALARVGWRWAREHAVAKATTGC